jgi:hypothetical protein
MRLQSPRNKVNSRTGAPSFPPLSGYSDVRRLSLSCPRNGGPPPTRPPPLTLSTTGWARNVVASRICRSRNREMTILEESCLVQFGAGYLSTGGALFYLISNTINIVTTFIQGILLVNAGSSERLRQHLSRKSRCNGTRRCGYPCV